MLARGARSAGSFKFKIGYRQVSELWEKAKENCADGVGNSDSPSKKVLGQKNLYEREEVAEAMEDMWFEN